MRKDNSGQAFPRAGHSESGSGERDGMTLRDYFAAKAMQAYVTRGCLPNDGFDERVSGCAYEMADAMLAARSA